MVQDIFQCDHPSGGPHIASCTQHSRRPKVTCHQESSAESVICCPLRSSTSGPRQDRLKLQITPQEKNVVYRLQCVVHKECDHTEGSSHALRGSNFIE
ncbi:hypothetical protein AVEN_87216-1 [Araneus ventricosus]|uniref:Uncharacterized protein n=1 Tax=Araneus ventricosus TaxID=182803 RepID=A0A4Y2G5Y0_ARAVE|nr:hypothetical protein AVEN_25915-1 [Araneus ventricosus]GBM48781.1 hypothetical protein AVEN_269509-1 [Araneus ventricosus]GBM48783.1 hypothetical protein AVEN_274735-1 [Araneus ventricosus]GBM48821.1 hypothetical protein AVEN_87216-1 [Araneus ventricosus]